MEVMLRYLKITSEESNKQPMEVMLRYLKHRKHLIDESKYKAKSKFFVSLSVVDDQDSSSDLSVSISEKLMLEDLRNNILGETYSKIKSNLLLLEQTSSLLIAVNLWWKP